MTVKDLKNFLKNKSDNCEIKNTIFINTGQDFQDNYSPLWEIEDTGDFIDNKPEPFLQYIHIVNIHVIGNITYRCEQYT